MGVHMLNGNFNYIMLDMVWIRKIFSIVRDVKSLGHVYGGQMWLTMGESLIKWIVVLTSGAVVAELKSLCRKVSLWGYLIMNLIQPWGRGEVVKGFNLWAGFNLKKAQPWSWLIVGRIRWQSRSIGQRAHFMQRQWVERQASLMVVLPLEGGTNGDLKLADRAQIMV